MKIFIGTDHAGFSLKEKLKVYLSRQGYDVDDMGAFELESDDDYPDFIKPVAQAVAQDSESIGITIGGSGQGEAMCANKVPGVRAAVYYGGNMDIIKLARSHNNANVLSLGARFISEEEAEIATKGFIETKFSGDIRHVRRIEKM